MESLQLTADFRPAPPPESEWRALADTVSPEARFLSAAWFDAWGKHILPYDTWRGPLRYVTAYGSDGSLRAVVPMAVQSQSGVAVVSLGGFYWPFRSPLISQAGAEDVCEALAAAFTRSRSLTALRFGPVPGVERGISSLSGALARRGWRLHRSDLGTTYAVDLPDTWAELEKRLGKSLRSNMQYYERKMSREGALEIRRIGGSRDPAWGTAIRDLGAIERRSWQFREGGKLRFCGDRNAAFWANLLVQDAFGEVARAWLMYFNDEPVSFCFCLDAGDTRYILANNYAESVQRYSTGSILYRHVFRDAIESRSIRRINIGLGDSGYKSRWSAQPAFELVDWIAFRPGLRGAAMDLAWRVRRALVERRASGARITHAEQRDLGGTPSLDDAQV